MQSCNLARLASRGHRGAVPRGRVPETERSPTSSPGGRHLALWHGARRNFQPVRNALSCTIKRRVAREGTRSLFLLLQPSPKRPSSLTARRFVSPDRTAGALKNMPPDQLEHFRKSFTAPPRIPGRWMVVLRVSFEQVRHHRVQGLDDPDPSKCQGDVPTHACDGLWGACPRRDRPSHVTRT